jgi:hypothetical protein
MNRSFDYFESYVQRKVDEWSEELGIQCYMFLVNMQFVYFGHGYKTGISESSEVILKCFVNTLYTYSNTVAPPYFTRKKNVSSTEISTPFFEVEGVFVLFEKCQRRMWNGKNEMSTRFELGIDFFHDFGCVSYV